MGVKDLVGQEFGRWTVVSRQGSIQWGRGTNALWLCRCQCGGEKVVSGAQLRRGRSKSCGCLHKEIVSAVHLKHGHAKKKRSPEYAAWDSMIQRCTNPKAPAWEKYGGAGITVDPAWMVFEQFLEDMGPRPPDRSLDRVDNSKGYYKANCRWATKVEQQNNRNNNRVVTYEGQTHTVAEWARMKGLKYVTLLGRINSGWPIGEALNKSV